MRFKEFTRAVSFFCLAALSLQAEPVQSVHTTIDLVSDSSEIVPGQTFQLAVTFDMEPEWHIYWENPGASGLPPELDWKLPDGFEAGEIVWPAPERISLEGLVSYGFKDTATLVVPVVAPSDLEPGAEIPVRLDLSFLICKEICLPGDASLELTLRSGTTQKPSADSAVFERAREAQPGEEVPFEVTPIAMDEKTLTVEISGADLPESLYFYAAEASMLDPNADQPYTIADGTGRLSLPLDFAFFDQEPGKIKGVLRSPDQSWHAVVPVKSQSSRAASSAESAEVSVAASPGGLEQKLLDFGLLGWLLLAFVGGLILNVMPCVLPVLSLKVFSLLNHSGQSRSHALAHGIAYTLGVVASFILLAAVLFSLRALGESIGWGFQLQNPGFVLVLGLVFFLFGLNLLGVFEIGSGLVGADAKVAGRKDLFGSFGVGVLAAVVGAPCVGPFVGGVSGVALQTNTFTGLFIFAMLGFGMASPFLFLAIFPKLVAYLPKPGPWMETFKQSMGFLLLAALVFLLYLLGQLGGGAAITVMLVVLLVSAIAAWVYGRWAAPGKSFKSRIIARSITILLLVAGAFWGLRAIDAAYDNFTRGVAGAATEDGHWAPWSKEAVEQAIAEGKPVFVDFTATWCLICQVNKKTALRTDETHALFEEYDVVSLSADWTRRDAAITAELEKFGRSGVPLYLLYSPEGEVSVLPQNLTNGIIREAVEGLFED
ncbi:protein-disulfide reductase DsbD family protein [Coraliomargarita sinensis]|nr:protein-disulfide reductase DsbD domain-containing protein [Coraliomargarita sinensis]